MDKESRKFEILYSIIKDYIRTAEPVGSRTIERKYNIGISSATIRNEMADLEEMGYLVQPHTSAGRIPSSKAYRLYVDNFMHSLDIEDYIVDDVRKLYTQYFGELNSVIEKTAELLTKLTNLTSLVTAPNIAGLNIKDIKLIHIEHERILIVVITREGLVKNGELRLSGDIENGSIEKINNFLNICIKDMQTELVVNNFTAGFDSLSADEQKHLGEIVEAIKNLISQDKQMRVYSKGITELFRYPEFQNMDKATRVLEALHRQDLLSRLLYEMDDDGVNIKIGKETGMEELDDCSVLTATYKLNGRPIGTVGIVGPTRIDYDYCVSTMQILTRELTKHIDETIGGND